jgi:Fur family ferric uptake transcriptional regulator
MNTRSKYKTKQREILLGYLKDKSGVHVTANDVCEYCKNQGSSIGQSTIYRHLESLVDEGIINKYIIDANSPACFEYVGEEVHEDGEVCFHCKCEKCGKLIHLHCDVLKDIKYHLFEDHKFELNSMRTVFYGVCEDCQIHT